VSMERLRDRYGDSTVLDECTREESAAFADAAILVVMTDREGSEPELDEDGEHLVALAFEDEAKIEEDYGERGGEVEREEEVCFEIGRAFGFRSAMVGVPFDEVADE